MIGGGWGREERDDRFSIHLGPGGLVHQGRRLLEVRSLPVKQTGKKETRFSNQVAI